MASLIAVECFGHREEVSKGASLMRALSVVLGGRFVVGNGKLAVGTVLSESSMWTKNLISLSVGDKTVSFLAQWAVGVEIEGASVVVWALGGSGGSPLPPSEVLAMVDS